MQNDYRDRQRLDVLLKGEIPIDSNEDIEFLRCQRKQFTVLDRGPALLPRGPHLMADKFAREAAVDTFIEKNLHPADDSTSRSRACSRS
jgi:hypothetical protein